jgi:hypothetical protein
VNVKPGYLGPFARKGLKSGAGLGVMLAALFTAYNVAVLALGILTGAIVGGLVGLVTGLVDRLAVEALLHVIPEPDYPEAGYPILASLLVDAALFGLTLGPTLGGFLTFVLALAATAIAVIVAQDILSGSTAAP